MFESLQADQRKRWERGERTRIEFYLERYPGLAADSAALMNLIGSEISLRESRGEVPILDEYLIAFPQCAAGLHRLFFSPNEDNLATIQEESTGELLVAHAAEFTGFPKIPGFEILAELGRG